MTKKGRYIEELELSVTTLTSSYSQRSREAVNIMLVTITSPTITSSLYLSSDKHKEELISD